MYILNKEKKSIMHLISQYEAFTKNKIQIYMHIYIRHKCLTVSGFGLFFESLPKVEYATSRLHFFSSRKIFCFFFFLSMHGRQKFDEDQTMANLVTNVEPNCFFRHDTTMVHLLDIVKLHVVVPDLLTNKINKPLHTSIWSHRQSFYFCRLWPVYA